MPDNRINVLLDKLLNNACSPEEKEELFLLIERTDDAALKAALENAWNRFGQPAHTLPETVMQVVLQQIRGEQEDEFASKETVGQGKKNISQGEELSQPIAEQLEPQKKQRKQTGLLHRLPAWSRTAIAAAILIMAGLGIYYLFIQQNKNPHSLSHTTIPNDVKAPSNSKATITLASGEQIQLDSLQTGTFGNQENTQLIRQENGTITYQASQAATTPQHLLNTLNNPRGSVVATITLADGTKVWLNAGSSLTYPVAFSGKERKVTLQGEGYFEVAHKTITHSGINSRMPFKVSVVNGTGNQLGEVEVLGTHFNINAYDDEPLVKTTLAEGRVKVTAAAASGQAVMLQPGQEAQVNTGSEQSSNHSTVQRIHVQPADIERTLAWKEGLFDYKSSSIAQVLRDVARWYDIEVKYEGKKPDDTFTGGVHRTATLSELLTILQMSRVRFRLEGKTLTVLSNH